VLWKANVNGPSIVTRARIAVILLTLVLGLTIYIWGRKLFGPLPALLSVTLFAFDPNILANGCLATNDIGLSLFATLTVLTFWQLLKQPSATWAVVSGLTLGLALTAKFSGLFLPPALGAIAFANYLTSRRKQGIQFRLRQVSIYFSLTALVTGITLWAVYAFQVGTIRGLPVPASAYLKGIQGLANKLETGTQSFLLGSYSDSGWWYYFPIAFSVKTPLPTLLLIGAAVIYAIRKKDLTRSLPLLIPIGVCFLLCCVSGLNIGYRHLIPMLPFLFIFAGQLAQVSWSYRPKFLAIGALLVWLIAGTLMVSPHYLAYFNELAGGPARGHRVLVDSNLDWGQDLPGLRDYMAAHNIASVKLAYCGTADPGAYGINYEPLPGANRFWWKHNKDPDVVVDPGPGVYAISATSLQGARYQNHDVYAWFRVREPDAVIGNSIFVYRVP
jgi:4-amino-4-deoxy-L-arabinose transferase-like glycosyltransferase